ncbi:MAG: NAD-dependent epimerase/dehydratase family protein [FCB group bacterium]|nr:NAD-dependent epimerase/dehydratase family protein [FCB group bacterium]
MENKGKILITGVAGFIGFHLALRLQSEGYDIVGIDNLNEYYDVNLKISRLDVLKTSSHDKNYTFIKLDIADKSKVEQLFADNPFSIVIHLAAQAGVRHSIDAPHAYTESNITGFLNILEGCRRNTVKQLIYASSSSVYGGNTKLPFAESDRVDKPLALYGATKRANELMAHAYSHLYGLSTIGLRFFTVYGPWGRPDMALFLFTKNILAGEPIRVFNYGHHVRSFTYIDDIVEGMDRLIKIANSRDAHVHQDIGKYKIFNIGGENAVSLMDYIREIENTLGKQAIIEYLPLQPGDVEKTEADSTALSEATGFKPQISIQAGIKKFVSWYLDYYSRT